jgi:restriction endonuclease Mrr
VTEPVIETQTKSLLERLATADLLERQTCLAELISLGQETIPTLLDHANSETVLREVIDALPAGDREHACTHLARASRRDRDNRVRLLALTLLGELFPTRSSFVDRTMEIARDGSESPEIRARAVRTLQSVTLGATHARDLNQLLLDITARGSNCPIALRNATFECLGAHAAHLEVRATMRQLDPFLTDADPDVRARALTLLGKVGEIDAIEYMCMLPTMKEDIYPIQAAITGILERPINLLSLRWEHFEKFVEHLLRTMGHEDVITTRPVADDGVDVVSVMPRTNLMGPTHERWVVQCKRWTKKNVGRDELEALLACSHEKHAKHALLITTSDFTKDAREYGRQHDAQIELISRSDLLRILDGHFGAGRYSIRCHD